MSAHKHTPGWYCANCQRGVDAREVTFSEQHEVCGRFIADDEPPSSERLRLIAAAPELLEAAMAFVAPFYGIEVVKGSDIAKARADIAKATGEPA